MKPNDKYPSSESPLDRIEKAFFNDAGFEDIDEIPVAKIKKTKIPAAPLKKPPQSLAREKPAPVFMSVPALITYGLLLILLVTVLLNNQIYVIPHQNQLKNSTLIATSTWILTPNTAKSRTEKSKLLMTIPAFSTSTLTITAQEPVNVEAHYWGLSIRANNPGLSAQLYLRDTNLLSNKFNPIALPVRTLQGKTAIVPVPLNNVLNESGLQKQKISDFKIEFHNPTAQEITVLVDKKMYLIPMNK